MWPHTIVAAVYAPLSSARRLVCLGEADGLEQLKRASSAWFSWLGFGAGSCAHAGWSVERLKRHVRDVQRRAQSTGAQARQRAHGHLAWASVSVRGRMHAVACGTWVCVCVPRMSVMQPPRSGKHGDRQRHALCM